MRKTSREKSFSIKSREFSPSIKKINELNMRVTDIPKQQILSSLVFEEKIKSTKENLKNCWEEIKIKKSLTSQEIRIYKAELENLSKEKKDMESKNFTKLRKQDRDLEELESSRVILEENFHRSNLNLMNKKLEKVKKQFFDNKSSGDRYLTKNFEKVANNYHLLFLKMSEQREERDRMYNDLIEKIGSRMKIASDAISKMSYQREAIHEKIDEYLANANNNLEKDILNEKTIREANEAQLLKILDKIIAKFD